MVLGGRMKQKPNAEQIAALEDFKRLWGRCWKKELKVCWTCGQYPDSVDSRLLQQIRNQFGPMWLTRWR